MAKGDVEKICFVISPIGGDETSTRKWADQTIKHLIRPAVEPYGLKVKRADEEDRAGIITTHIIQRLVTAELVIADLTGRNPNVFYELAVRHITRKPLIQIIRAEEEIPFDVQSMRTVKFELNDPDTLEGARQALERQVAAVLEEEALETPISQAVGQQLALESGDPEQVEIAELARAVQALTAEVRARSRSTAVQTFRFQEPEGSRASMISEVPIAEYDDPGNRFQFLTEVDLEEKERKPDAKGGSALDKKRRGRGRKPSESA